MKYIYYTAGILVLLTAFLAFPFHHFRVETSKPAIVINDRVISEKELEGLLRASTSSNHSAGAVDAVITNELLIQEALAQGINKEESFRASVENFYEQSLIKILIDRTFKSLTPKLSEKMVERYAGLAGRNLVCTRSIYDTRQDVETGNAALVETITANFDDLSDELKFTLVKVEPGEHSDPVKQDNQFVCYRVESATDPGSADAGDTISRDAIREFLIHQEKGAMFARWMEGLTKKAHIQILTDRSAIGEEG